MSHVKTWACIKPDGDGCDGDHNPDTTQPCPGCRTRAAIGLFVLEWIVPIIVSVLTALWMARNR